MALNFSLSLQLITLALLLLLTPMVSSRHVHSQTMAHKHPPRQFIISSTAVNATATLPFASEIANAAPPATAAAATSTSHSNILFDSTTISDIQDIAQSLHDFPSDLLTFTRSVEARLGKIESLLESLVSCSSISTTTSLLPAANLAEPSFWSGTPSPTSTRRVTFSSSSFPSPIAAVTTTYTTHIQSTLTRTTTSTSTNTDSSSAYFSASSASFSSSSFYPSNKTTTIAAGSGNGTVSSRLITAVSPLGAVKYTVSLALTQPLPTTMVTSASMSSASVGV